MPRNLFQSVCALAVSLAFGFFAINQSLKIQEQKKDAGNRMPQSSVNQIYAMLEKIERDLNDPSVFNRENSAEYIKSLTDSAYNMNTSDIYPDNPQEQVLFAETRKQWMEKLFRIQLKLRNKMIEFNAAKPLTETQVAAFRNGNMYLSYAQDFVLMEWSRSQDLVPHQRMFTADFPANLKNSELKNFHLMPGDIILVRGGSFISATIARTGDYLSNFSHVAMVIQDSAGNISVAEALMEEGLIVYSLDKYLSLERLSRAAVMRPKNSADGKAAALAGFKIVDEDMKSPVRKMFDMLMIPGNHDKIYCFELIRRAYQDATHGRIAMPTFPMSFKKALAGNSFYKGLGNKLALGAAPDDAFFQPEFDVLMFQRDVSMIKQDWAFDVAMSSVFEFMNDKYEYKRDLAKESLSKILHFIKNDLKIPAKKIPPGVSSEVMQLILEHKALVNNLRDHLMKLMNASPRPLAYKELEVQAKNYLELNKDRYFVPCNTRDKSSNMCSRWFK